MSQLVSRRRFQITLAVAASGVSGCAEGQSNARDASPARSVAACRSQATRTEAMETIANIALPGGAALLSASRLALQLAGPNDRALAQRLRTIANSETETALLQLNCVDADRPPGAVWEVYVGLPADAQPNAESPHFVGAVALYGDGVRSESRTLATFSFALDRAIVASQTSPSLNLLFLPSSGVVADGAPTAANVLAPVRIREIAVVRDVASSAQ